MPSNNIIESSFLWCRGGTTDKVYNVYLKGPPLNNNLPPPNSDGYRVVAHYGRRGGKLKEEIKATRVTYHNAKAVYDGLIATKINTKGYRATDTVPVYNTNEETLVMDIEDLVVAPKVVKFRTPKKEKTGEAKPVEINIETERKLRFGSL